MNRNNLLIAALIGAALNTAVTNIPFVNLINLLLCIGFWGGSIVAIWYYSTRSGKVTLKQGVIIGLVTGLFSGLLGFLFSLFGLAGIRGITDIFNQFGSGDSQQGINDLLAGASEILFNLCGVIVNIIMGALGGLIGGLIFRKKE
jgi:hypothetical protein